MVITNLSRIYPFIEKSVIEDPWTERAVTALKTLKSGMGAGSEFTGWLSLPGKALETDLAPVLEAAGRIRESSEVLVVIGIGGSYLGARAVSELLVPESNGKYVKLIFAGTGLGGANMSRIIKSLEGKDFSICVISKSGTTMEPAVAFRILNEYLVKRYGDNASRRVYAVTDAAKGVLYSTAKSRGYTMFVIPDDVGGRYSVLSPVGLLPLAAAGVDIEALLQGALRGKDLYLTADGGNEALKYAAARQALYNEGKRIEVLSVWEPEYRYLAEWWKQLYGESEGKDGKGIFPASLELTADLHSMGQYMQEGERIMFETFVWSDPGAEDVRIPYIEGDPDKLNYLAGKMLSYVNRTALDATIAAHVGGSVPCIELKLTAMEEKTLGALIYFFETACAVSGYMMGVNPFDQPGVEAYKTNMFRLLGRP